MADDATREIEVPDGSNRIVVTAHDHTYVGLERDGAPLVTDHIAGPETAFVVAPGAYAVRSDGAIDAVAVDAVDVAAPAPGPLLALSSDAPDRHPVDGIGELAADGTSFCTITVQRVEPAEVEKEPQVFLRTTGGRLANARGSRIRSVRLRNGRASFRLIAEETPRLVTVMAFAEASAEPARLDLEFI